METSDMIRYTDEFYVKLSLESKEDRETSVYLNNYGASIEKDELWSISFKENPPSKEFIHDQATKIARSMAKYVSKIDFTKLVEIHVIKKLAREKLDELIAADGKK